MYGRYTKDLGEYAKEEAKRLKLLERRRKQEDKERDKVRHMNLIQIIFYGSFCNVQSLSVYFSFIFFFFKIKTKCTRHTQLLLFKKFVVDYIVTL